MEHSNNQRGAPRTRSYDVGGARPSRLPTWPVAPGSIKEAFRLWELADEEEGPRRAAPDPQSDTPDSNM